MSVEMGSSTKKTVYVNLLGEGTPVVRPVVARQISQSTYELQAPDDYDPEDEEWEFPPFSTVVCEQHIRDGEQVLIAVSQVDETT